MFKLEMLVARAVSMLPLALAFGTALLFAHASAADTIAFNQTGQVGNQTGGPYDLGSYFTVNAPIVVTDLGAFDPTGTGLTANVFVSIYQIGNSTPLVSKSLTAANTHSVAGSEYEFLNGGVDVNLAPGNYIVVGSNFGAATVVDNNSCCADGVFPITNSDGGALSFPTFGTDNAGAFGSFNGSSPTLPTSADTHTYLAGTFTFVTPEPSTLAALCGLGVVGLVALARRRAAYAGPQCSVPHATFQ
jgi:hypothetical protein